MIYAECLATTQAPCLEALGLRGVDASLSLSIVKALREGKVPSLQDIKFHYSSIEGEGIEYFSKAIENGAWPHLQELSLEKAGLGAQGVEKLMKAVLKSHGFPSLKKFELVEDVNLKDEGVMYIAEAIEMGAFPNLEELAISECGCEGQGLAALSRALKKSTASLTKLNLHDNRLADEGIKSFADAVHQGALPNLMHFTYRTICLGIRVSRLYLRHLREVV